jgi:hypothetical protein
MSTVDMETGDFKLLRIKLVHTIIWAIMATGILSLPWIAWTRRFELALWVTLLVLAEGVVLVLNHWHCPLTDAAARYTNERTDNFDIYLPAWLARHNKLIFTSLFLIGELLVAKRWLLGN